ncbi:oxygen-independent coproporphyrinogen-3 oxidase [Cytobacillus eiseniae]|uniref:Heme chaperone HemW n=1 Tax=Cytobacillus eiseniae TaxID=762947 RepID=A0ABS4RFL0_9BACI|nr:radical SAM family heme chaperone HemW [Cytobacillus eiseniae]MBP2241686.1 oxygen-independent coproporphyrinogen-3 oxidase [Cytobacillus eiseniae]
MKAAYIHIPFCEHICHYCDFNKVFLKGQPVDAYLDSLAKEMEMTMTMKQTPTNYLETIFIGGGTPTALNESQLEKLCQMIKDHLPYNNKTEFTFEANPGDLSAEKLRILFQAGVNRISFGVQTFNEELLKRIGRVHRAKDVYQSIDLAKNTGFENISIDLMYSLPGQTLADFKETLHTSFSLDIKHYSGYSLIIEPKTIFYNLMQKGKLPSPGEDVEAEMYDTLMEEMDKHGFKQYEISNFSKPGYESQHNLTYWNNEWYYGFGAGAHGYVNGYRMANHGPLKKYMDAIKMEQLPVLEKHQVSRKEQIEEEMFLGLRKTAGVNMMHFQNKYEEDLMDLFKDEIHDLSNRELIVIANDHIQLTKKGRFLGNEVFQSFLR